MGPAFSTRVLRYVPQRVRWHLHLIRRRVATNREIVRVGAAALRVAVAAGALVVITYVGAPWLPNPLGIRGEQAAVQLLAAVIGALATILGILLAVALVAFELSTHTYRTYALRLIFRDPRLTELVTLFLATIVVSVGTLSAITAPLSPHHVAGIYASLVLFLISLIVLVPYCKRIIGRSHTHEDIRALVSSITREEIERFGWFHPRQAPSEYARTVEESPLFILGEIGARTLMDRDRLTPKLVIAEAADRLLKLLDAAGPGAINRRSAIVGMLMLVRPIARTAIETRSEGAIEAVIHFVERIHSFGAEHSFAWHEFIELDTFFADLLQEIIEVGLVDAARQGMYSLERIAIAHLRQNVPPESEIWELHVRSANPPPVKHDADKSLQWNHMSAGYVRMIGVAGQSAAAQRRAAVIQSAILALANIETGLVSLPLGDLQKGWILNFLAYQVKEIALTAARHRSDEALRLGISPFSMVYLDRVFETGKPYARGVLMAAGETFVGLAEAGVLSDFALNDLVAFGRGSAKALDQPLRREAVIYITRLLSRLREIVESRPDKPSKQFYLAIYDQMRSLREWLAPSGREDLELAALFEKELGRFDQYDAAKGELSSHLIPWPTAPEHSDPAGPV